MKPTASYSVGLKIFEADPELVTVRNALYVPRIPEVADEHFGLFNPYGRAIEAAVYHRTVVSQSYQPLLSRVDPVAGHEVADPSADYVYVGTMGTHYGHFLASVLSRFWCDPALYRNARLVVHYAEHADKILSAPWFRFFMNALGIELSQFVSFSRPTVLPRVLVPAQAFGEEHYAHTCFHDLALRIRAAAGTKLSPFGDRLYLSRTRLQRGVRHFAGEQALEELLKRDGFQIVYPETLSPEEQVVLFEPGRFVTGITGSAFHNSIFAAGATGLGLTCFETQMANYQLMDAVSDARIGYREMECSYDGIARVQGFAGATRIVDPAAVAAEVIALSRMPPAHWQDAEPVADAAAGTRYEIATHHGSRLVVDQRRNMLHHVEDLSDPRYLPVVASRTGNLLSLAHPNPALPIGAQTDLQQEQRQDFLIEVGPGESVYLRSVRTGRYLVADPEGRILCNTPNPGGWECFTLRPQAPPAELRQDNRQAQTAALDLQLGSAAD